MSRTEIQASGWISCLTQTQTQNKFIPPWKIIFFTHSKHIAKNIIGEGDPFKAYVAAVKGPPKLALPREKA
jgi:hypothetical protein